MNNLPEGAEYDEKAPYNERRIKIDVTISQTLSKTITVEVPQCYNDEIIRKTVERTIDLPSQVFIDWDLDDYETIEN